MRLKVSGIALINFNITLLWLFQKYANKILGANFDIASPWEVQDKLSCLINEFNNLERPNIDDLAKFHLEFERIHPFQDGNGRIGRFIFLKQLLENKLALKYMNGDSSQEYKTVLAQSSNSDITPLVEYLDTHKDFIKENKNMF